MDDLELADLADLSGLRVLVVEDDIDAREMLMDVLAAQGAEVKGAGNGADAIDLVSSWNPDVLVSDIGLPDHDGYYLIRKVRALSPAEGGRVPAIALTGYGRPKDVQRAMAAGFTAHLDKPVNFERLLEIVLQLVGA